MRVFRKVVLPLVWVAIFLTIAVSLAVMAFESPPKPAGSGVKPTGEIPVSNTIVERGTVENTLELNGTIVVDPPASAKASHEGVINHFFVPVGAKVKKGDNLFQVKVDEAGEASEGDGDAPKPKTRYYNTVAPKDGKVASFAKELDDTVTKGDVVVSIRQSSFRASGSISPIDQYRLLKMPKFATVTIDGGPAPFKCGDLLIGGAEAPATPTEGFVDPAEEPEFQEQSPEGGGEAITCRVPQDLRVFDGLSMTMVVDAGTAKDVLVVPVTAVRGLVDSGTVWVTGDDGAAEEREVSLGISDGSVVEVTKGLKEGENVLEFVPGADSELGSGGGATGGGKRSVVEGYAE